MVGHVVGDRLHEMIDAYLAGRVGEALEIHRELLPVYIGIMTRTQGAIATKAALSLLGLPGGTVRGPLIDATPQQVERLRDRSGGGRREAARGVQHDAPACPGGGAAW